MRTRGLMVLAAALAPVALASSAVAQDAEDCVCPVPIDEAGSRDSALEPEQTEGSEPDDFEFEPTPDEFGPEQTDGNEPDDFEFEQR